MGKLKTDQQRREKRDQKREAQRQAELNSRGFGALFADFADRMATEPAFAQFADTHRDTAPWRPEISLDVQDQVDGTVLATQHPAESQPEPSRQQWRMLRADLSEQISEANRLFGLGLALIRPYLIPDLNTPELMVELHEDAPGWARGILSAMKSFHQRKEMLDPEYRFSTGWEMVQFTTSVRARNGYVREALARGSLYAPRESMDA